jgi:hypothetical protein
MIDVDLYWCRCCRSWIGCRTGCMERIRAKAKPSSVQTPLDVSDYWWQWLTVSEFQFTLQKETWKFQPVILKTRNIQIQQIWNSNITSICSSGDYWTTSLQRNEDFLNRWTTKLIDTTTKFRAYHHLCPSAFAHAKVKHMRMADWICVPNFYSLYMGRLWKKENKKKLKKEQPIHWRLKMV